MGNLIFGLALFFATHPLPMAPALRERAQQLISANVY